MSRFFFLAPSRFKSGCCFAFLKYCQCLQEALPVIHNQSHDSFNPACCCFCVPGWGECDSLVTPDGCFRQTPGVAVKCLVSPVFPSLLKDLNRPLLRLDWLVFSLILKCGDVSVKKNKIQNNGCACLKRHKLSNSFLSAMPCKLDFSILGMTVLAGNESGLRTGD